MNIKIKLKDGVEMPKFQSEGAAGFDVSVNSIIKSFNKFNQRTNFLNTDNDEYHDGELTDFRTFRFIQSYRVLVGTGIYVELEKNTSLEVRSRSGLSLSKGITVLNQPGTIDSDYRGEVCVILINESDTDYTISKGDRIAQLVPRINPEVKLFNVDSINNDTERGDGGFGSTGK